MSLAALFLARRLSRVELVFTVGVAHPESGSSAKDDRPSSTLEQDQGKYSSCNISKDFVNLLCFQFLTFNLNETISLFHEKTALKNGEKLTYGEPRRHFGSRIDETPVKLLSKYIFRFGFRN